MVDCHLFALHVNSNTKLDHMAEMLEQLALRSISCRIVLVDSWYITTVLVKWLLNAGKTFYCPLKSNRLVDDSGDQQPYQFVGVQAC